MGLVAREEGAAGNQGTEEQDGIFWDPHSASAGKLMQLVAGSYTAGWGRRP